MIDDLNRRLSAAEVAVRQQDADDQLDKDLLAAAAAVPARIRPIRRMSGSPGSTWTLTNPASTPIWMRSTTDD